MDTASARTLTVRTIALSLSALLLAGCSAGVGSPAPSNADAGYSLGSQEPSPPAAEVIATGTVIDVDGDAQLCLGAVMESYPPQCVGVPLEGWSWAGLEPDDESGTTRWGAYGMSGTYDGTSFTPTHTPVPLALFDTVARPEPINGEPGAASEKELATIQETITTLLEPDTHLTSGVEDGYLVVDVVWDDGTLQEAADEDFGRGVVVIRSALWTVAIE
ncbi:hypothetical protein [Microbacterium murale]|uniref:Secreted protein n=1 Tax=Microbacterium murale TaxID=1081040 RepID=A0ABU0PEL9_9MICO|nr:hypothetical protein [Microbacterium murale]MDQ0645763.1 hypothetical protein [Microbacterium murale]